MAADLDAIAEAVTKGRVVAIPTDTVYGLAALPSVHEAILEIFELKGRAVEKGLPVLGAGIEELRRVAKFEAGSEEFAARFWPGPLTLVLHRHPNFTSFLGGDDRTTVAVRVPGHPLTRELLRRTGPLAVTSANLSGSPPAESADQVATIFPDVPVLDGGRPIGRPSTVLSLLDVPKIAREGALTRRELGIAEDL